MGTASGVRTALADGDCGVYCDGGGFGRVGRLSSTAVVGMSFFCCASKNVDKDFHKVQNLSLRIKNILFLFSNGWTDAYECDKVPTKT